MKTIKWVILFVFVAFAYTVSAQADLMIKVTNVRSDCGKVMIATDKGQYNMVDAKGAETVLELKDVPVGKCKVYVYHDENGNYQLDKEGDVPLENCAIVDLDVKAGRKEEVNIRLVDVREKVKK